jgi:hypothetical protein
MLNEPARSFEARKPLQHFLEDDSKQAYIPSFNGGAQGFELSAWWWSVPAQGYRPNRSVHQHAHRRSLSFL